MPTEILVIVAVQGRATVNEKRCGTDSGKRLGGAVGVIASSVPIGQLLDSAPAGKRSAAEGVPTLLMRWDEARVAAAPLTA